jgi:hypothetical protein
MAFDSFKSIAEVLTEYQITSTDARILEPKPFTIPDSFRENLAFYQAELTFDESESAVCEMIIFPILSTVYRQHYQKLSLWSHKTITYDNTLTGIPDYILAKRSPLGKVVFDKPYFTAVEAKRDDFIKGWGQCLAQMVAMQKLNETPDKPVYGIVTNGQLWQFGRLIHQEFHREIQGYTIFDLDTLMAVLNFLFQQCEALI